MLVVGAEALALAAVARQFFATLEFAALASRGLDGVSRAGAGRRAVEPATLLAGSLGALAAPGRAPQPFPWLVALPMLAAPLVVTAAWARGPRRHAGVCCRCSIA